MKVVLPYTTRPKNGLVIIVSKSPEEYRVMVWEPRLKSSNNLSSSKLETSDAMFSTQIMHQQAVKTDKL